MLPLVPVKQEDIEQALAAYLSRDDPPGHEDVHHWARFHNALPLILDMGGCIALRTNGELISFAWDHEENALPEIDPYNEHIARAVGSRKYPEILGLAPVRGADASACTFCGGSGVLRPGIPNLVCRCGGLGWVPAPAGS